MPPSPEHAARPPRAAPRRILVRDRHTIVPVATASIVRIEAEGDYVLVHTLVGRHIMRAKIGDLEQELGEDFLRVHRSHLLNLDHVVRFESNPDARLEAVMADGSRIVASRGGSQRIRRRAR